MVAFVAAGALALVSTAFAQSSILLSASQVTLYEGQIATNISVSIPSGVNASNQVEVDIYSADATIATPVGGSSGFLALYFPAGGTNVQTFSIQAVGAGTVQFSTANSLGMQDATLNVTVNPTLAVSMIPSTNSIECWTNSTLGVQAIASGIGPFHYLWFTNGVEVAGFTNATFSITNLALAVGDSYTVSAEVTNATNSVTSQPLNISVVQSPPVAFTVYNDSFSRSGALNGSSPDVTDPYERQWIAGSVLFTDGTNLVYPGQDQAYLPFTPQSGHIYTLTADMDGTTNNSQWLALGYTTATAVSSGLFYDTASAWTLMRANHAGTQQSFIAIGNNLTADAQDFECYDPDGPSRVTMVLNTTTGNSVSNWTVTVWEDGVKVGDHVFPVNPDIQYVGCGGQLHVTGLFDNFTLTDSQLPPTTPSITQQPASSVEQYQGGNIALQVLPGGFPPFSYQWQEDSTNLVGATNSTLVLTNVNMAQSGNYRVIVSNAGGSITSSNAVVSVLQAPPQATVLYADTFTGSGGLNGRSPEINVIGGSWSASPMLTLINDALYAPAVQTSQNEMAFLPFTPQSGHVYVFSVAMNPLSGGTEWAAFGLTANASLSGGDLPSQGPGAWMLERYDRGTQLFAGSSGVQGPGVNAGYTTWKMVLDTTTGTATNGWTIRFVEGTTNGFGNLIWSYVYSANPTINYVALGVEANQGVSADFDNFEVSDSVVSTTAAKIGTQPVSSIEQYQGGDVSLHVMAYGTPPLSYQWQEDQTNLVGATSSTLMLTNLNIAQSGTYRVIVSNAEATVISSNSVLTVLQVPPQPMMLYSDGFSGSGSLNGSVPGGNYLGGAWSAVPSLTLTNGVLYAPPVSVTNSEMAYLPFTPQVGHVYVFSVAIDPLSGGTEWAAFGLTATNSLQGEIANQNAGAWMLERYNRGTQLFAGSSGIQGPDANPGYTTWKIVLDTTTGSATTGWTVNFVEGFGTTNSFGNLIWSHVYNTNPTIHYLGLGVESNQGVSANFDNLNISDSIIPPGLVLMHRSGANLELDWSQGLLLQAPTVNGPWTTNSATPPSFTVLPTAAQQFYRVIVP